MLSIALEFGGDKDLSNGIAKLNKED